MFVGSRKILTLIFIIILHVSNSFAGEILYPESFNDGDTLTAEILANQFNEIKVQVDDNAVKIQTLSGKGNTLQSANGNDLNAVYVDANSQVGIGTLQPLAPLDIHADGTRSNTSSTEGDLRVGDDNFRFKLGIATSNAEAGDVRFSSEGGGNGRLVFGGNGRDVMDITPNGVNIDADSPTLGKNPLLTNQPALYVRGSRIQSASLNAHIMVLENTALASPTGTGPDVMALVTHTNAVHANGGYPQAQVNYITFYDIDSTGDMEGMGAIEANGQGGISLNTVGADYAEWLEKLDPKEKIESAQVVGLYNGKITKRTDGADRVFAISSAPAVVGNYPGDKRRADFKRVGMLGQVLVVVRGPVTNGDIIIASGTNDGTAVAMKAENVSLDQWSQVIGRAWQSSEKPELRKINVAIGVSDVQVLNQTLRQTLKIQTEQISYQQQQIERLTDEVVLLSALKKEVENLKTQFHQLSSNHTRQVATAMGAAD